MKHSPLCILGFLTQAWVKNAFFKIACEAQKYLLHRHEDQSSDTHNPCQSCVDVEAACNPSPGRWNRETVSKLASRRAEQ